MSVNWYVFSYISSETNLFIIIPIHKLKRTRSDRAFSVPAQQKKPLKTIKRLGGIRGTVVAHWTVDRSCTRGMIHNKIHLINRYCPRPSISLECSVVAWNTIHSILQSAFIRPIVIWLMLKNLGKHVYKKTYNYFPYKRLRTFQGL